MAIVNSPYRVPERNWALDKDGHPTDRIIGRRRMSDLISAMSPWMSKVGK